MFGINYKQLEYKMFTGVSNSNTNTYEDTFVMGCRVKGNIKVTHSENGDTSTCSIVYRTDVPIVKGSLLDGREVMECVPITSFGFEEAYLSYVK